MLVIVWFVHLYGKITSVSYLWAVHLYGKITSVSYCMGCASVWEDNQC